MSSLFIKNSFLPEEYIQERLTFFAAAIKNNEINISTPAEWNSHTEVWDTSTDNEELSNESILQPIQ